MTDKHTYKMTMSLNVLKHLGVGLYSNIPAVLSEAVANAWDADANNVTVNVDSDKNVITIEDDGHGMNISDINAKYLRVGYERRKEDDGKTPGLGRTVMGRKGIGKLSLFSIARTVTVYSTKEGKTYGFQMDVEKITNAIKDKGTTYYPESIPTTNISLNRGTRITLSKIKREVYKPTALRKRLARRFSVIGDANQFNVYLNGKPITIEERDYYKKLQHVWTFGKRGESAVSDFNEIKKHTLPSKVEIGESVENIDGWIGTVHKAGQLKDADTKESINKIVIMVRGKLAQEDILSEFGEGGIYTAYIMGEIHADFLDQNDKIDSATTNRQGIIEDDPRYQRLRDKIRTDLKTIQQKWSDLRNDEGEEMAFTFPNIKEWYDELSTDHRVAARKLFGRINQLHIDDDDAKRQMFVSGVLAFESLKYRNLLTRLDDIQLDNLEAINDVFIQLDDLEANAYYQITKNRLEVISKLSQSVKDNVLESVVQKLLFDHLWLLDPSWERAASEEVIESGVKKAFGVLDAKLTEEERRARLDIKYTTTAGKHVIVELKRPNVVIRTGELVDQISKYRRAALTVLESANRQHEPIEFVCILGQKLQDWNSPELEQISRASLEPYHARVVMYNELINNAQLAYKNYIEKEGVVKRLHNLITSIMPKDTKALNPPQNESYTIGY